MTNKTQHYTQTLSLQNPLTPKQQNKTVCITKNQTSVVTNKTNPNTYT